VVTSHRGTDVTGYRDLEIIEVPVLRWRWLGSDLRQWLYNFRLTRAMAGLLKQRQPDVLYERYSLYSTTGMHLARRFHLPRILEVNTLLVEEQIQRIHFPRFASWMEDRIVGSAPAIIVVSTPLRDAFVSRGIDPRRISIMPMAVDVRRFHPNVEPADLRARFGLNGKTIVGYTGTLTAWHGIDLLFDVAERFKALDENVVIVVIGGDPGKVVEMSERVRSRRLGDYLIFAGSVPYTEVPHYISAVDITVIPGSIEWASPTKLFEYQAMGKPSVAPRLIPVADALTDGREGYLFRPGDVSELTDRILRLHHDSVERLDMGRRARQRVVERHAWEHNTGRIIEMFTRMMQGKPEPAGSGK
jgi:glycosyltransferase involved in cell wall biosynthesis